MRSLKFQSKYGKYIYFFLYILIILIQTVSLNNVSKENSVKYIQKDQQVFVKQIEMKNKVIKGINERLETDTELKEEEIIQLKDSISNLQEENAFYTKLNRYLQTASVQLTFYNEYNDKYIESKIDYLSEQLSEIPSTSDLYADFTGESYMNLWFEVIDLLNIKDKQYTSEMYEVHLYERVYLNIISFFGLIVVILYFVLGNNFLKSRFDSILSFVPKTFTRNFFEYYGKKISIFLSYFFVSLISFFGYLFFKGYKPLFDNLTILYNDTGTMDLRNFMVIFGVIVAGWTLVMLLMSLIKEVLSVWIRMNIISTLLSLFFTVFAYSILNNFGLGLNIFITPFNNLYIKYGTNFTFHNILLCLLILFIICMLLFMGVKYSYNRVHNIKKN